MKTKSLVTKLLIAAFLAIAFAKLGSNFILGDYNALNEIGLTTAEMVRLRGFMAEDHYVSSDGYMLNVVKATNPLVDQGRSGLSNKSVVLFIHGILADANCFICDSIGASPKDYSHYNANSMSRESLDELLLKDQSINALPFLLMNFGHEVWLLNRRGTFMSMGRTNGRNATKERVEGGPTKMVQIYANALKRIISSGGNLKEIYASVTDAFVELIQSISSTINSDYWRYSMDEQAEHDFPNVIDYIRESTGGRPVSIVAHSAGGAITLLALINKPDIKDKLGQIVLWSPAINLGHDFSEQFKYAIFPYILTDYVGPIPPLSAVPIIQSTFATIMSTEFSRRTIGQLLLDAIYGRESYNQNYLPGFAFQQNTPTSSFELAHLVQSVMYDGIQHKFDFGSVEENRKVYGQDQPPAYNLSRITATTLTLYGAKTDSLVGPNDVRTIYASLSVPADIQILVGEDGYFNHLSYLINRNVGKVVGIPSLIKLEKS